MANVILSIDQGTTSTRAFLIDHDLNVRGVAQKEFKQYYPKPGWVEHDPEEIWRSALAVIGEALAIAKIKVTDIAAIGITNQRETTILWERKTSKALHPAIVWQDRRTQEICEELKKKGLADWVREKTGLILDPYFSGTKVKWLLDHVEGTQKMAARKEVAFGTIDTYLLWRLTGGACHATDATNASRTLLFNLNTLTWDPELLEILNIPSSILPEVTDSSMIFGHTKNCPGLPDGIPISGIAGDQQAALFGQACFEVGEAKCTYGTGSFILINIGGEPRPSKHRLITTIAWKLKGKATYAWEGSAFIAGAAVQWLRDGLGIIQKSSEVERLAGSVPDSGGVYFVPSLVGLGAPHWRADVRGVITGINRGTTAAHIARATIEGIAFLQYDILEAMAKELGKPLSILKVDGGASINNLLMQFQSDILQVPISRPALVETTALGAAFLAGLGVGLWNSKEEIRKTWREEKRFVPSMNPHEAHAKIGGWRQAVAQACH